jgi:signal transduction histidine kinase
VGRWLQVHRENSGTERLIVFRTLYSRLAVTLFVLLCVVGLILALLIRHSSELYQQEITQQLNTELAEHIVAEEPLFSDDRVNDEALKQIFHMMMVINPSIELYLLDDTGAILGYSAPEGRVQRDHIDLEPIKRFHQRTSRYPLLGDDPRNPTGQKVFSAARIPTEGPLQGYLYIILGSQQYDNTVQMLHGSYILRLTGWGLVAALMTALLAGMAVLALLTRRLSRLSGLMRAYGQDRSDKSKIRYPARMHPGDEIDDLGVHFNRMADQIEVQLADLEKTDKVRRELIANVSHDLRTPLTTLQGYLETLALKGHTLDREEQQRFLQIAIGHSKHLSNLVSELFELARLDSIETVVFEETLSLGELVQDVTQEFMLEASETGVQLCTDLSETTPMIRGDIAMLQRVLENLIENAIRYTPAGGRVTVGVVPKGDTAIVKVADTGQGIPAAELEHIFDRFYRVQRDRPMATRNSGLGLAIAKRILELHGATLDVESELDKGTTFSFRVPVLS